MKKLYLILLLGVMIATKAYSQIVVTNNTNAQQLAQTLAGTGVAISNWSTTCDNRGTGTFTNSGTPLGIPSGVVLATGRVNQIAQAAGTQNYSPNASTAFNNGSDANLAALASPYAIVDKCILEFDLVPQGNVLRFNYTFASEEYPEWVCSDYNDVFGFFISGQNPLGGNYTGYNLARIPSTTLPVAINSLNPGAPGAGAGGGTCNGPNESLAYSSYYVSNAGGTQIAYDGLTTTLQAIIGVIPCQTYHLKLAVGDAGDAVYDSGIFIQSNSLTSQGITVTASSQLSQAGYSYAYEGCVYGMFTLTLPSVAPADIQVSYNISGTATNGVDYNNLSGTVVVPQGQQSVNIIVTPVQDGIIEGLENVTLNVINPCDGTVVSGATLTISDNPTPAITVGDSTLCSGQSTTLTAGPGATFAWSPPAGLSNPNIASPTASPTSTTTYTVNMTFGSCASTLSQTIYVSSPSVSVAASPTGVLCNGATTTLTATPAGGITPYTYSWSTSANTPAITASATGNYVVTVTDNYGCTATASQSVTASSFNVTAVTTNINCFGQTNGAIDQTVTGNNSPFSYSWADGPTSQDRTGLSAGTYNVTVTNSVGCTQTAGYTISAPGSALTTSETHTNLTCNGAGNGSIDLSVSGGSTPYTYNWGGGIVTQDRSGLGAGTYTVTVTDNGGCTATRSVTITQPAVLATSFTRVNVACFGGNTGSINLSVTGGTTPYGFAWSNGATTEDISGLVAGSYVVTVTDANNCTATRTIAITQPASGMTVSATPVNVTCFGTLTGAVNITVTSGVAPLTYLWSNGATTQNITGVAAGIYTVTVTGNTGCTATASATVTQPVSGVSATSTTVNVLCNGGNTGSINITATGGTGAYTYNWGGGITTEDRTAIPAGTYTVTVTDANSCTTTHSATITQPSALSASFTSVNLLCNGVATGSINITATGGTGAYTYNWGGGVTTEDRSGLAAGTYTVTVTDANNCTTSQAVTITQPAALTTSETHNNVRCFGANTGSINLTVNGGTSPYNFIWSNAATTEDISTLTSGNYTVTVTDANGCTATRTINITQPALALSLSETHVNVNCFGGNTGSIDLTVTGGTTAYSYNWGGGVTTQDRIGLAAGTYTVTVTDAFLCTATLSATITQPAAALATSETHVNINCFGGITGSIDLTVTGGTTAYSYNWGGGVTTQDRTGLAAGTYTVTVTDANNCTTTRSVTITQPAAALSTTETHNNVSCNGGNNGSVNLTVSGGTSPYTFAWSNAATTEDISTLTSGSYTVTVTDANGCTTTRTITITQPTQTLTLTETHVNVNCFGGNTGSIDLAVTGGTTTYSYNWGGGVTTQDRTGLAAGTYTVTVTDANLCTATLSSTIAQPAAALATSETHVNVNCFAGNTGSIDLTVTGGTTAYSYNWGGGVIAEDRTGLAAGTYTVNVTDANNCTTIRSITITQPAAALSTTETHTNVSCNGGNNGSVNLSVNGGTSPYTFAWSNAATTEDISTLTSGSYTVTVTDANGCTTTRTISITQPVQALTLTETHVNVNCFGGNTGSIDLTVTGGTTTYSYNWGGGVTTQDRSGLAAGTYTVTVTDANLCTATLSATITQPAAALATSETHVDLLCNGASTGSIDLSVSGGATPYNFNWGAITTEDRSGLAAGTYTVTVTDANSCTTTRSVTITQSAALSISQTHTNISCNGLTDGTINITVSGGTGAYTYNWGGGITTEDRTGLAAGNYTITVTDANNCTASLSVTITEPTVLSLSGNTGNSTCMTPNGTATVVTNGSGTGPYNYLWSHNGSINSNSVNGLAPGPYSVTVTDANGCSATITINVGLSGNNTNASFSVSGSTCFNDNNVVLTHTGSSALTSQVWTYGDASANGSGSPVNHTYSAPGTYNITHIVFRGFCSDTVTQPVTINVNPTASSVATNVLCFGANTGAINVTAASGSPAYSYNWGGGVTTEDRANIAAGTYTVTVTDVNGCTATTSATITQPAATLSTTETHTNVSCNGGNNGSVNLTVTGGTSPYTFAWSNAATTEDISTLTSGSYTVTVTDANGCTTTRNITITQPAQALTLTETHINVNCFGGNTGSVNLTVSGGTSPYTYTWTTGATTQDISALANGTYDVTVTDANLCTATLSITINQPASALATSETHVNVNCFGGNTGSIDLTVSGGTTAYTYNWGGGITTQDRTNLVAGNYTVTVTDANSCTATQSVTITQPAAALTTTETHTNVSCNGGNNGSINLTVNGGTTPYTFAWSNTATTEDISTLTSGNYTVTVTDANGCTTTRTVTITQPTQALTLTETHINVNCFGGNTGSVNLTVSGGTSPYTYTWTTGATTQDILALANGTYDVTVTDANSCTATLSVTITQPASALATSETHVNVNCFGGNTGSIDLTVSGGTTAYTYNWGGGVTTQDRTNLVAGNYTVTVTDANSCTATQSVTITQPAAALTTTETHTNVSCNGGNNGSINLTVNGGTTPYTFAWSNTATTEDIGALTSGSYTVTVTDANGCTTTITITITQPVQALTLTETHINVNCFGGNTGSVNLTVSGGTSPYTYTWTTGATTQDISALANGTYDVTVTDANLCTATLSVTINQPASALATTETHVNVNCFGGNTGSIDLTVSGGTTAYTYNWGGGVTAQDRIGLAAGTYTVTVTDANSCTATQSVTISQPAAALSTTETHTNVSCNGGNNGSINLTVNGGTTPYTFAWSNTATTEDISTLTSGSYTVTVTDANGCTTTRAITITQPALAVTGSTVVTNVSCNSGSNGAINLTVSGGTSPYTFIWSNAATTEDITVLVAGTYTVTVNDANNCSTVASATITEPAQALSITETHTNVNCFGNNTGVIDVTVSGGTSPYTYNWGGGITTQDRANLLAGNYNVTVTDANACTATLSVTIIQPAAALSLTNTTVNVSCNGGNNGAIDLTVNGGTTPYTFNWAGGVTTEDRTALIAGTYAVTVTDANNCTISTSINITQPAAMSATASATNVSCNAGSNGTINITVTGGAPAHTYLWNDAATTEDRSGLTAGTYSVTITDANSCSITTSTTITEPAVLSLSTTQVNVLCNGGSTGSIDLTVTGGTTAYTYNWGGGVTTQDRNNIIAGTYTVTVTDANSCGASITTTITEPSALTITSAQVNIGCFGGNTGAIDITATGGTGAYTYNWGGGITTEDRTNLTAGTYTVTVIDANSCSATLSATITQPAAGLSASTNTTNVLCFGGNNGAVNLTVNGGTSPYAFVWSNGATTEDINTLAAGTYTVTITDANSCTLYASATITEPAQALTLSEIHTNVNCFGNSTGAINLTVTGGTSPYTYNWGGGVTTQDRNNIPTGTYTVSVTDANACSATLTVTITEPAAALSATTATTNVLCFGGNNGAIDLTVSGGTTVYTYNWGGGVSTEDRIGLIAGTYTVTITDANACTLAASATINQPASALALSETHVNVACFGNNTASIDVTTAGGTSSYSYSWNDGVTTEDRTGLSLGTYTLTATDANGCTATINVNITQPAQALTVSETHTNVNCFGNSTASIDVTVTGGTSPYNYSWSGAVTTQDRNNIPAGTYTVSVTDANSCSATLTVVITEPAQLQANTTHTNVLCNNGNTGTVDLTVNGGVTAYQFLWSNTAITEDITGLVAGTYTVTVTDGNNCTVSTAATITQPAQLQLTQVTTNALCFGNSNGAINVTTTGGTTAYQYLWNNALVTEDISGLTAGNYSLTVTDANNCTATISAAVTEPAILQATTTQTDVVCFGQSNATINLTVTGGTTNYTYNWTNGATTQDLSGLAIGTYSVTVTDANACSATASTTIAEPTELTVTEVATNVSCYNGNDGSIDITVAGGTTPYLYSWGNGSTAQDLTGLTAAGYSITVTDAHACTAQTISIVGQPSLLQLSETHLDVLCNGGADGFIDLSVSGGTVSYSYNWSNGVSTEDNPNLGTGSYTVTVTDFNGCTATLNTSITQPVSINITAAVTQVSCFGGNNGAINISVNGGIPGYSYNWSNGATTQDLTNLTAGAYTLTITDLNSCTKDTTITISQPAVLQATATQTDVLCFGASTGAIDVTVTGGTTTYTYNWAGGANTQDRNSLPAGNYTLSVTDANGCSTTLSRVITQPTQLQASIVSQNVTCNGANNGSVNLTANGGVGPYTFAWTNAVVTEDISNLAPAAYTVTVTDFNACTVTANTTITQPAAIQLTTNTTNILCNGGNNGAINLTVVGGTGAYTYTWSNGATTQDITGLTIGTYTVTVADQNSCTATISATITEPAALQLNSTFTNVACYGANNGAVNLEVLGGVGPYTYLWSNSALTQDITTLVVGTYDVTVTDANGCTATHSRLITQTPPVSINVVKTDIACFGGNTGAVNIAVSGGATGFTYNWSNGAGTEDISGLAAGTYVVTVTDANNCTLSATATVAQPTQLTASISKTDALCHGSSNGAVNLNVSGGSSPYVYNWSNNTAGANLPAVGAGSYSVIVTDAHGCTTTAATNVAEPIAMTVNNLHVNPTCYGANNGAIDLTANGGTTPYAFNWSNGAGTEDLSALVADVYTVTVTDINSCTSLASVTLTQPSPISVNASHTDLTCFGAANGSINITVSGGLVPYNYIWSNGAQTQDVSNLPGGQYSVVVSDANNCQTGLNAITLLEPSEITITASTTPVACSGGNNGSASLTILGGVPNYQYNWSNNTFSQNLVNVPVGTYTVTVTDANGCTQTGSATIVSLPSLDVTGSSQNMPCSNVNGNIDLTVNNGTAPFSFIWSNGATSEDLTDVGAGSYSVTVTDDNGCPFDTAFVILNNNSFSVDAGPGAVITLGQSAQLNATSTGSASTGYEWNTFEQGLTCYDCNNPGASPAQTTTYTVVGTDANGCMAEDTVTVTVISDHTVFTPNSFTPNGDGQNDTWKLFGNLAGIKSIQLLVFDRWGEKVFESAIPEFEWDAVYKGEKLPPAVYVYVMKIVFMDGSTQKVYKGSITLLR